MKACQRTAAEGALHEAALVCGQVSMVERDAAGEDLVEWGCCDVIGVHFQRVQAKVRSTWWNATPQGTTRGAVGVM